MNEETSKERGIATVEETPNKADIDWIENRLLDIYNYDRLKDCDINYLYNLEFAIEARLKIFKMGFPRDNGMGKLAREWAGVNTEKEPLTDHERTRLELLKMETRMEIHRAYGHRLELRREHRGNLANAFSDMVGKFAQALSNIP